MPEPVNDLVRLAEKVNRNLAGPGTEILSVTDKYAMTPLADLPLAPPQAVDRAVEAAVGALPALKALSAEERAKGLLRVRDALADKREAFARLIQAEAGKPIDFARVEVDRALENLTAVAAEALRFCGEVVPMDVGMAAGRTAYTRRFPVGPVAAVTPFNFPLNLVLHKLAPALAVGAPVVLKPAPQAPLTGLALAGLFQEAGFPEGSVNAFVCGNQVAEKLVTDERMGMLSFTGSARVGWHLKSICGRKKTALELGGNAAALVDETADIPRAARTLAIASHLFAGQICISTQRVYVIKEVFGPFVEDLLKATQKLVTGDPAKEGVHVGPLIDRASLDRVASWVDEAKDAGAKVLCGGRVLDPEKNLYEPTWLTDTRPHMNVAAEEIFGPVALVEPVEDFNAALAAANDSIYGLQAGVFTQRIDRMKQAADALEVGAVVINSAAGFRVDTMPYGGVKQSGLGREGARYAMEEMTSPRLVIF